MDGTKTAKCDRCDVTDTIADPDSALGHSFTIIAAPDQIGRYTGCPVYEINGKPIGEGLLQQGLYISHLHIDTSIIGA